MYLPRISKVLPLGEEEAVVVIIGLSQNQKCKMHEIILSYHVACELDNLTVS